MLAIYARNINMSTSKRLGFLLLLLIILAVFSSVVSGYKGFDLQQLIPQIKSFTKTIEMQKVVTEESATITVVEKVSPSVVSVVEKTTVYDFFSGPLLSENSIGTGFAVEPDLVVTNKHVVSDTSAQYTVVTSQNKKLNVIKVYRDPINDLAILKIENGNLPTIELGNSDTIKVGQTVLAVGNALGEFSNSVTRGIISGIGRGITAQQGVFGAAESLDNVIQTDAALSPGNSGGPLVNLSSQVIGVNVAVSQSGENIGFSLPVNKVTELLANFKANKKISRAFLGVSYMMINQALADDRGLAAGALVREITPSSAAQEAGLKVYDIITKADGNDINDANPLANFLNSHKAGDKITLTVWRAGKTETLSVTLKEAATE